MEGNYKLVKLIYLSYLIHIKSCQQKKTEETHLEEEHEMQRCMCVQIYKDNHFICKKNWPSIQVCFLGAPLTFISAVYRLQIQIDIDRYRQIDIQIDMQIEACQKLILDCYQQPVSTRKRERGQKGLNCRQSGRLQQHRPVQPAALSDNDASNMYVFKYANQQMMKLVLQKVPPEGS